jgi:hypothetical protein
MHTQEYYFQPGANPKTSSYKATSNLVRFETKIFSYALKNVLAYYSACVAFVNSYYLSRRISSWVSQRENKSGSWQFYDIDTSLPQVPHLRVDGGGRTDASGGGREAGQRRQLVSVPDLRRMKIRSYLCDKLY